MDKKAFTHRKSRDEEVQTQSRLLEQLYVHGVYENIAEDFEHEEHQPWPEVKDFLRSLPPGSIVADIGCGNGLYLNVNPNIAVVGIDRSSNLLASANDRASGVTCRADCLSLPYRDSTFDAVLFVGVIHHLVTPSRQAQALQELARITRPHGTMLMYAWAWEQQNRKFKGQDLLVPRQVSTEKLLVTSGACNCCISNSQQVQSYPAMADRLGRLLLAPQALIKRLLSRHNSLGSSADSSSTDSLQSYGSEDTSDETIEVPEEFQVREFPASSLFSSSKSYDKNEVRMQRRECVAHTSMCAAAVQHQSREDRFYHVFKKGELERLIRTSAPSFQLIKCVYKSGHYLATLRKKD